VSNRLNGWQRLWVVLSALWLVVVVGFTVFLWPTSKTMWHRDEFIRRMPADARAHVAASYSSKWQAREDRSGVHQLLPNGAVLIVRGTPDPRLAAVRKKYPQYNDLTDSQLASALRAKFPEYADLASDDFVADEDVRKVVQAYFDVVEDATRAARWSAIGSAVLIWLAPCFGLYILGWAVAWVRRGFRASVV